MNTVSIRQFYDFTHSGKVCYLGTKGKIRASYERRRGRFYFHVAIPGFGMLDGECARLDNNDVEGQLGPKWVNQYPDWRLGQMWGLKTDKVIRHNEKSKIWQTIFKFIADND